MAYIARVDGTREAIKTPVSLERAQEVVGGYVERVCPRHSPKIVFLCNEDGFSKGLQVNAHGCELYGAPIVGCIVVFESRKEAKGWL
jgi:hypothetical protein